jgi:ABC-2 type transport system permease protein
MFCNTRTLGFPLVLYFVLAVPNRDERDFGSTDISIPLYHMGGLLCFAAMMGLISSGARTASERTDGWIRQLRVTPTRAYFPANVLTGYTLTAVSLALLHASGLSPGGSLSMTRWLEMTALMAAVVVAGESQPGLVRRPGVARGPLGRHRRVDRDADRCRQSRLPP